MATANSARRAAGNGGHGSEFVKIDVCTLFADDFVAVVRPDLDGNEIAHAASGNKKRGFLGENFGGAFLEEIDGGIFAVDVIADISGGHGLTHFVRRARDSVAAEIDGVGDGRDVVGIYELITFGDGVGHWLCCSQKRIIF